MNSYLIPPGLAAILNFVLVIWVYTESSPGLVRTTFILWNLEMAFWSTSIAIGYPMTNELLILRWYKATIPFAISFMAPCFLHFVIAITNQDNIQNKLILCLGYFNGLLFTIFGSSGALLIHHLVRYYWGYYPVAGPGVIPFSIAFFGIIGHAFYLLWATIQNTSGYKHEQLRYLFWGAFLFFGTSITNFLPLFGIAIYPMGNLMNAIYSLFVAYAIVEHGLMDIQIVLRRGTVYMLLSGSLTAVYLSLVAILQRLFGRYGFQENVVFYTAAFPFTVVLAPTMKSHIEPFVDQALFGAIRRGSRPPLRNQDMTLMGILATEMAHELAKPLTHIMNAGSRLDSAIKGSSRENLRTIEKEVQRASEILDGFAMLSPERTLHCISVPLTDLIEEAMTTLDLREDKTLQVVRRFDPMPPANVNPGQIVQVLTNLIQNAWQAMPEGGRLTLTIRPVTEGMERPEAEISITDTGLGIDPNILEKVFEPFFTTKEDRGGRGMGLTISRAMVERHGGIIDIQSPIAAGRGTRVIVRLPMKPSEGQNEK